MNVNDAAHAIVREYPGGSESLASRLDMSPAILRNKANPNTTTHRLAIEEAVALSQITGDLRILQAFAAEMNCIVHRADAYEVGGGVLQMILGAQAKEGAFAQAVNDALSDNVISANELKAITSAGFGMQEAVLMLLQKLRAMAKVSP